MLPGSAGRPSEAGGAVALRGEREAGKGPQTVQRNTHPGGSVFKHWRYSFLCELCVCGHHC